MCSFYAASGEVVAVIAASKQGTTGYQREYITAGFGSMYKSKYLLNFA
jgi:hypothetical protein